MPGTGCAEVCVFATPASLPPDALALLDQAPSAFAQRAWWDVVLAHATPPGTETAFVTVRAGQRTIALFPMARSKHRLQSLTTPYTCDYAPLFAEGLDQATRIAAAAAFVRFGRPAGTIRLDALPAEWHGLDDLLAGTRLAGLRALRFDHFGNWHEAVGGQDWASYLHHRPGALRETIRRRLRRADTLPGAAFTLLNRPDQMDQAARTFETVYRQSWKDAEPFPTFNVALMQALAASGCLRFASWTVGETPVAAQIWLLNAGSAIVLKLAHAEAYKALSPGTVLTALMLRHLLDQEHVAHIDFGRGDDTYKQGWARQRRQRIGLLLANPWSLSGAAALLRHSAGRARSTFRQAAPDRHPAGSSGGRR